MQAFKKNLGERFREATARFFRFDFRPRVQWRRLMIATTVLGFALAAAHVYLFYRIENHTVFGGSTVAQAPAPVVNEAKLTAVLRRFDAKASARAAAALLVPAVQDPSK